LRQRANREILLIPGIPVLIRAAPLNLRGSSVRRADPLCYAHPIAKPETSQREADTLKSTRSSGSGDIEDSQQENHSLVLPETVSTEKNKLYYGDNLEVLKLYVKDESVDLVYLDPPFNSRLDYNVLFAEKDGTQSSSQIHASEDTWEWNTGAMRARPTIIAEIVRQGGRRAAPQVFSILYVDRARPVWCT